MPKNSELNLLGVGWPVCLLECKRILKDMVSGDILEISMQDPDAVRELVTIVERSPDQIVDMAENADHFQIRIQKG